MTTWQSPFKYSHHTERKTMPFELPEPTKAKIAEVIVLADKDREPDTNPGAGLDVQITTSNYILSAFDGALRGTLYTKTAASSAQQQQGTLDGVEPVSDMPNLTSLGRMLGRLTPDIELTGYTMTIDRGLGGKNSDIELTDCKLSNFSVLAKEGGSVVIKLRVESPNVSEKLHGWLAVLKTTERPITLIAPEPAQSDIEEQ